MTDTEANETFPAGTAAYRIDRSVRLLARGFTDQVMTLEAHTDVEQADTAVRCTNRISRALHELEQALSDAAFLLTRNDLTAPARDIDGEDRALARFVGSLVELAEDMERQWATYDDPAFYRQEGRQNAGDDLRSVLQSQDAVRAFAGRRD